MYNFFSVNIVIERNYIRNYIVKFQLHRTVFLWLQQVYCCQRCAGKLGFPSHPSLAYLTTSHPTSPHRIPSHPIPSEELMKTKSHLLKLLHRGFGCSLLNCSCAKGAWEDGLVSFQKADVPASMSFKHWPSPQSCPWLLWFSTSPGLKKLGFAK